MTKTLFYGASTVAGEGASTEDHRFSAVVCHALGWEEINFGIGGTCVVGRDSEGMVVDLGSGIGRVPEVIEEAPDLIFIHYGSNDFGTSKELGEPRRFQQGTFFWDFDTMLRGLLEVFKPEQIFLSLVNYRSDADTPNAHGLTLKDYNRVIREAGERYGICVIDSFSEAGIDKSNWDRFSADDIHLNDDGHQLLAAAIVEAIHKQRCL